MDQGVAEFNLPAMADDVKDVLSYAKERGMSMGIINSLQSAFDGMVELKSIVKTQAHEKRIKVDLEELIGEVKEYSKKGQENLFLGRVRTLRDRVNTLNAIL